MSNNDQFFLRQNIQLEPLVDRWYAWSFLIPPATAARNLTERHIKIMDSYIGAPEVHANAVRNPKLLGGPFMDFAANRVAEIQELKARTLVSRARLVELSTAIFKLDALLRDQARGATLQPLYSQVPDCLKGYVELVYDLNNHASFRLIEPLLYCSDFYDPSQQGLALSVISNDDRPFILSTPRLDSTDSLYIHLPFAHESIDQLFQLKSSSRKWPEIRDLVPIASHDESLFRSFFTHEQPAAYVPYEGRGIRWRYFGHACILIESNGVSILFDPVLSYTYDNSVPRYTYLDLPETIDYVFITHNHQDHVLFETLLQIRHKIRNIVVPRSGNGYLQDPSLRLILLKCGFKNVMEMGEMEELLTESIRITAVPFLGEHSDLNIPTKMAWLVSVNSRTLLFAADSCNIEPRLYQLISKQCGRLDALFVGMECDGAPLSWLYGPLLTQRLERSLDMSRRLAGSDCDQVLKIIEAFSVSQVFVYAMGQEPWLNYIMSIKYTVESRPIIESNRLIERCRSQGIHAERLYGEKEILIE
jgi:L-ascorbate metabolism protein UlaG (beta-lactamase superfamily)